MENIDRDAKKRLVGSKPEGQSVREFCKENNLREAQYFYWRNKLNKENQPQQDSGFTAIRIKTRGQLGSGVLASLDLPGGAILSIYDPAVIPLLGQLIG
jgi:hypothetical protein